MRLFCNRNIGLILVVQVKKFLKVCNIEVELHAEASVHSTDLYPTVLLALDCHSLAGGFSGQSRQIMVGLEERQDGGKQRRKVTAMPLNDRELV